MLYANKSLKQRLLSGGIWAFFAKAGTGFLTIALTALVTRILEPKDVGVLFLSFSIIIMMSLILRLGMDGLGIKLIGEALSEKKYHLAKNTAFRITKLVMLFSIIWTILVYILFDYFNQYFFTGKEVSPAFHLMFSLWIMLTAVQHLFAEIFRAYHHIGQASVFAGGTIFGGSIVSLIVGIFLLTFYILEISVTLEMVLAIILLTTFIALVIEIYLILKLLKSYDEVSFGSIEEDRAYIGYADLIKQGFPFFISYLSLFALIHMDTVILGIYHSKEDVAVYAAATRIVKLIVLSLVIAYEVVAPVIVELNAINQKNKLERILRIAATLAAIPATIVLMFFIFYSESVLGFLYGEYYKKGAMIIIVMSLGQLINVSMGLCGPTLNVLGFQKINMYIYGAVTIIALTSCIIFAKDYGAISIAYIISVAWALQGIITLIFVKYLTGMWTHIDIVASYKAIKGLAKK